MSIISNLLGHILRIIFEFVNNYGLSIVVFTLFVRLLLVPLMVKQIKSQKAMQDIQPKIKEIQEKYKNKPEKQQEELMKIYQEAKINPLAGCLPLLIQMPILIGLFNVLRDPVTYGVFQSAAEFAKADTGFLWIQSISSTHNISLALLSGISAYFMQKMMTTGDEQTENMMKSMTYVMSAMSLFWGYTFQAGLAIYWITSNIFSIAQYQLITSPLKAKLADSKEEVIVDGKSKPKAISQTKKIEIKSKTKEEAMEIALQQLGIEEKITGIVNVIQNPSKGFLGIVGAKDGVYEITVIKKEEIEIAKEFVENILVKSKINAIVNATQEGNLIKD